MTDPYDRASEREQAHREDALQAQTRRAGLTGKTLADSATHCGACQERIPLKRRRAVPGVQTCVPCQTDLERSINH